MWNCCGSPHWGIPAAKLFLINVFASRVLLEQFAGEFQISKAFSQLTSHWEKDPIIYFQNVIYFCTSSSHTNTGRPSCSILLPPVFFYWYRTTVVLYSYDKYTWHLVQINSPENESATSAWNINEHWRHSPRAEQGFAQNPLSIWKRAFKKRNINSP